MIQVMINRNRREHWYYEARGEILERITKNSETFAKNVFINQERKLEDRRRLDTALVLTINDANQRSA